MSTASPFLVLNSDCDKVIKWLTNQLANAHLTLLRTFSSSDVRAAHTDCLCPHHGTSDCNCQVVIFLVYRKGHASPVSLIAHGYDQYTLLYLVDTPQQRADPCLETAIRNALIPEPSRFFSQMDQMTE